jgi:uncharacterized protein (DUF1810 family)
MGHHDLERFVHAQADDYDTALAELRAGRKRSHWIWYVFPQLEALGSSPTAKRYGIGSLAEAQAYLAHPLLGTRLVEATTAALTSGETDPHRLFGSPDDLQFRSSMTLFAVAGPGQQIFRDALDTFYGGEPDTTTLDLLGIPGGRLP